MLEMTVCIQLDIPGIVPYQGIGGSAGFIDHILFLLNSSLDYKLQGLGTGQLDVLVIFKMQILPDYICLNG